MNMLFNAWVGTKLKMRTAATGIALAALIGLAVNPCYGQADPQAIALTLPTGVQEVIKLTQAGMGEDVILAKIRSDGVAYNLNTDQIIYLSKQAVPQHVISALMQGKPGGAVVAPPAPPVSFAAPAPVPTQPAPEPVNPPGGPPPVTGAPSAPPTFDSFHDQLSPYGGWIQTPDGWVWHPNVDATWRPYLDGGHWEYTDAGWYWASDYPWGDIVFHYGRWSFNPVHGWIWAPAYEFAPAWVCWRHADDDGYCGWAPLPPGAVLVAGGWHFHGVSVGVDFDFGLGPTYFNFVAYDHFWDHDCRHYVVGHDHLDFVYHHSVLENHVRVEHGVYIHEGLGRDRVVRYTHRDVSPIAVHDIRAREEHEHVVQREHDREVVHAGGHVDASHTMSTHDSMHDSTHDTTHDTAKADAGSADKSHANAQKSPPKNGKGGKAQGHDVEKTDKPQ